MEEKFKEVKFRVGVVIKSKEGITLDNALAVVRSFNSETDILGLRPEIIIANCIRVYEIPED